MKGNDTKAILRKEDIIQESFPKDLIEFSQKVEQEKLQRSTPDSKTGNRFFGDGFYASPIIVLNHRDLQALAEFFNREDMKDINLDLNRFLKMLLPDFCVEEKKIDHVLEKDPAFDFLQEYL
jgi:hypothetical protein